VSLPPFQALLDDHRTDLYRFLVASVGPGEADDCFQETVIAALRAYPRLDHAENLRGWLLRIAQRKAIDAHRATSRRPVPVESVPENPRQAPSMVVGGPDEELWAAVRELPFKQRTAVFCRTVMDMPYGELADLLDCSQEAARRSAHEGLKRLREEWSR
jgi:RNA polymerase sigma factor (sigma-70 family)